MFAGHFAVAFAAKRAAPRTSLGMLLFGAQFLDLIWPALVLLGAESFHIEPGVTKLNPLAFDSYPISHSLVMALVWSLVVGGIYYAVRRYCAGAVTVAAAVFSHWVLDWVTHRPDLQLAPGVATRVGLGLWNHPQFEVGIESAMFGFAVAGYAIQTKALDGRGRWGFILFVTVITLIWIANVTSPPPPANAVRAIAWTALAVYLFVLWAWWFDRHRDVRDQRNWC